LPRPAAFDLGEAHKVVVLSVTEGEDKPLKYPDMFHAASLMLLNKIDLLPYLQFDMERCLAYARRVNPGMTILPVSATAGAGLDAWIAWLRQGAAAADAGRRQTVATLRRQVAELEARRLGLFAAQRDVVQLAEELEQLAELRRLWQGRLRVLKMDVRLTLGVPAAALDHLGRVLGSFESYCTVTQSVRAAFPVTVEVFDAGGTLLHPKPAGAA